MKVSERRFAEHRDCAWLAASKRLLKSGGFDGRGVSPKSFRESGLHAGRPLYFHFQSKYARRREAARKAFADGAAAWSSFATLRPDAPLGLSRRILNLQRRT